MKHTSSLFAIFLISLSPLFAELPTVQPSSVPTGLPTKISLTPEEQNKVIASQLAPLYKEQFHLLRSKVMPYQVYEKSDSRQKLGLQGTWGQSDGLFNERKKENFSDPANILDALGLEYALHLDLIKRSYGITDESNNLDQIASTSLSASDLELFNNFKKRLPQVNTGDVYDIESHDTTTMISNAELRQYLPPNIVAMESSFLKLELLSFLLERYYSQETSANDTDFIKQLDQLPVTNYDDLVLAQHKMVDLENKLRAPLSPSEQHMKEMEEQERGVEMWMGAWEHKDDESSRVTNLEKEQDSTEKKPSGFLTTVKNKANYALNDHPIVTGVVMVVTGVPLAYTGLGGYMLFFGLCEIGRGIISTIF